MVAHAVLSRGASRAVQPAWEPWLEVCHLTLAQLTKRDVLLLHVAGQYARLGLEEYVEMP